MKKEIIGVVRQHYELGWTFDSSTKSYSSGVPSALDELLGLETKHGEKYKVTIEKMPK